MSQLDPLSFSLHLHQCNWEDVEKRATEANDPENKAGMLGQFLTASELHAILKCPEREEHVRMIEAWLRYGD